MSTLGARYNNPSGSSNCWLPHVLMFRLVNVIYLWYEQHSNAEVPATVCDDGLYRFGDGLQRDAVLALRFDSTSHTSNLPALVAFCVAWQHNLLPTCAPLWQVTHTVPLLTC